MARSYKLILSIALLAGCGYQPPKDQCVGKGTECRENEDESNTVVVAGPKGDPGVPGKDGRDGAPGPAGRDGKDGASCTASRVTNGAVISCTDGTSVVILDGEDGEDAPPTAYTITEMIDPCGRQASFDEVLLRLANRTLIAHFSSGSREFLTVIGPGSYITTDGTDCRFTVDSNLEVRW